MESPPKWKLWLGILTANLLLINIALAFLWINRQPNGPAKEISNLGPTSTPTSAPISTPTSTPSSVTPTSTPVPTTTIPKPTKNTSYMPIPGSGSVLSDNWTNLTGTEFYFNPADFPGLIEVHFEVNMRLFNGNGLAFLRLFDITNGIEIWGSDIQTGNQASTVVVSDKVQFRSGNNLVVVQAKSLTADTTIFNSGRLKITSRQ